jgi:hypothetical protein
MMQPNKAPELNPVVAGRSAIAVHAAGRRWLSFFRLAARAFLIMRSHLFILVAVVATFLGCSRTSQREARFLQDRKVVVETVQSCFQRPYEGLSRWMPKDVPRDFGFPGEDHIRMCMHSSSGWFGDDQWEVIYRPTVADSSKTAMPIDTAKLLDYYFSSLEVSGFTSGVRGIPVTSLDSMQAASKSWANTDRTLLVTGYVVSDRHSGETIITIIVRETINH